MQLVVDASVAAAWLLPDESSELAEKALDLVEKGFGIAPYLLWYEIRNVLVINLRRKRITPRQLTTSLEVLESLGILLDRQASGSDILSFAQRYQLSFYDAAYLELAKRHSAALATLDARLAQAAAQEGITPINAMPSAQTKL